MTINNPKTNENKSNNSNQQQCFHLSGLNYAENLKFWGAFKNLSEKQGYVDSVKNYNPPVSLGEVLKNNLSK